MKFLCVNCNEQMELVENPSADSGGSLSIVYGCPSCAHQICMLTNPAETQVVTSMGVQIGKDTGRENSSKCPFGDVVAEFKSSEATSAGMDWTVEARQRLQNIPEMVRPMAKEGIEGYARTKGYQQIDERVLDEAREEFGM
jgi:hypothetical protein